MMLFVTILEKTPGAAIQAIRDLRLDHDGVEVRVEEYESYDPAALRAATSKPMILTRRGGEMRAGEIDAAIAAGIEWVDVEFGRTVPERHRARIVLSHHDYEGMPDLGKLIGEMRAAGCAHIKIAVTPQSLQDNFRLLDLLESGRPALHTSVIGMGERGLFSRIAAPFLGSELTFAGIAAPGQITLERALGIYGDRRQVLHAKHLFAIVGSPGRPSRSPAIHNRLFREKGVPGAYTIASVGRFEEAAQAFQSGRLSGMSVTAPFKEDALRFAEKAGLEIAKNAREARAVNTVVDGIADNTDVDGFETILRQICGRDRKSAAVIGAGATGRSALVALRRLGVDATIFNRRPVEGAHPLEAARTFDGEIVINTLPPGVPLDLALRPGTAYIEAAYDIPRRDLPGVDYHDGLELLHAQAVRQHQLFMRVFDEA